MHIFDELKERGLIFQTTDEEALRKALEAVSYTHLDVYKRQILTSSTILFAKSWKNKKSNSKKLLFSNLISYGKNDAFPDQFVFHSLGVVFHLE